MWCRSPIGTMWIKVSVSGHAVGLPDVDEIREVGKAAHFCNKEGNSYLSAAKIACMAYFSSCIQHVDQSR